MSQEGILNVVGNNPSIPTTFVGNVGTATPILNELNIFGSAVAATAIPVQTVASSNTVTTQVQRATSSASSNASNVGLASFSSTQFSVDSNGFVTFSGAAVPETLTGNSGGPVSPTGNNLNTIGVGSITIVGNPGTSTLTTQLTGLNAHNVLVGAGSTTITNIAPSATSGIPLVSNGNAADPIFSTALIAGGGTASTSFNINGAVFSNTTTTGALQAATLSSGQLLIGGTTTPAAATLTAGVGISISNGNNSITITATAAGFTWSDQSGAFNAAKENGYFITGASTATLPAAPANGDTIKFIVNTASTLTVTANTGQTIRLSTSVSAAAGTAANTNNGDTLTLVYRSTNTQWIGDSFVGSWSIT